MPVTELRDLIGQPEATEFLRGIVERGRFANAYLFHGPAGVGKGSAAIAFARALLCAERGGATETPQASLFGEAPAPKSKSKADAPEAPPGEACGRCAACLKSASLQHPDLKLLFPVSGEESKLDETINDTLAAWRDDPLHVFNYEKAASIRLSLTRELLREMAFKPYEATRRIVVVRDADRMREDQYSAMLKAIEEPGNSTLWVLTTSRPNRLPATIRSRCQKVRFRAIAENAIEEFLVGRVGVPARNAGLIAALSTGSIGRALTLRDTNPVDARNESLGLLGLARRGDPSELWKAVQAVNKFGKMGRETMRRMIEFQLLWQRDLLRASVGAPAELLVHRDREPEIRRAAERIDATEIRRRLMILEECLRSIEGNITADLALFSAESRLANPALSRTGWPRHVTDRWRY